MILDNLGRAMQGSGHVSTVAERVDRGRWLRSAGLWLTSWLAIVIGDDVGRAAARMHLEPSLVTLLHMMAAMKVAMAGVAFMLVTWRFTLPTRPALACGYCVALGSMTAAAPLIWHVAYLAAAGVLFYTGLFLLLALAYVDRDSAPVMITSALARWRPGQWRRWTSR